LGEINYKKLVDAHKTDICNFRDWFKDLSGNQSWKLRASDTHMICDRLNEKHTIDDLKAAVNGMRKDPMINSKNCQRLSLAIGYEWIDFRVKEGRYEESQEAKKEESTLADLRREENAYATADNESLLRKFIDRLREDRAVKTE